MKLFKKNKILNKRIETYNLINFGKSSIYFRWIYLFRIDCMQLRKYFEENIDKINKKY